jgi:hypothetical protein
MKGMIVKSITVILGTGCVSLVLGCASAPVAVAPVGPNPTGLRSADSNGQLQVFSAMLERTEAYNPVWFQHTDYTLYDLNGKALRHVHNVTGNYAQDPPAISLPPGRYIVKAQAHDYLAVRVPVVIDPGRITRVHLNGDWQPTYTDKTQVVALPTGTPVGWTIQ